ncbi:hypothetical protein R6Q59_006677 [Mikania micrantha]
MPSVNIPARRERNRKKLPSSATIEITKIEQSLEEDPRIKVMRKEWFEGKKLS